MKILIDIGHPAHVHYFKNFARIMLSKGNDILFVCRDKEFEIDLLNANGFEFISLGKHYKSIRGKIFGLLKFDFKMLRISLKFKPDLFLSAGSMYAAHVSFLIGKPHIAIEDSENMEQIRLYKPFTKLILTPDAIPQKYGKKQIRFNGFHQSAYLHPNYFKRNLNLKKEIGVPLNGKVFLLRLVALNASHDVNLNSIDKKNLNFLINFLKEKGHLFISSEKPLPKDLEKYRLQILPEKIHSFLSICDLVIGESGAMTNESAYLGIPNILIVNVDLNVHKKYCDLGLKFHYHKINDQVMDKIKLTINDLDSVKKDFKDKSNEYIKNSIDLTDYLIKTAESLIK
jgi:hypothetical protein